MFYIPILILLDSSEVVEYVPSYNWTQKGTRITFSPMIKKD